MNENINEIKNEVLEEIILRAEVITLVANKLTELRLKHNFTLLELEGELDWAVESAMSVKDVHDPDFEIFHAVKEHFFLLFDRFSDR